MEENAMIDRLSQATSLSMSYLIDKNIKITVGYFIKPGRNTIGHQSQYLSSPKIPATKTLVQALALDNSRISCVL